MAEKKFNVKYGVLLPIVLLVTLFLWCVPVSILWHRRPDRCAAACDRPLRVRRFDVDV